MKKKIIISILLLILIGSFSFSQNKIKVFFKNQEVEFINQQGFTLINVEDLIEIEENFIVQKNVNILNLFFDNKSINVFNIKNKKYIFAKDLRRLNFDVSWNSIERTVNINNQNSLKTSEMLNNAEKALNTLIKAIKNKEDKVVFIEKPTYEDFQKSISNIYNFNRNLLATLDISKLRIKTTMINGEEYVSELYNFNYYENIQKEFIVVEDKINIFLEEIKNNNSKGKINKISSFIMDNIRYNYASIIEKTPNHYYNQTIYGLNEGYGVCGAYANSLKYILEKEGIRSDIVFGYINKNIPHVWNKIYWNNNIFYIDLTQYKATKNKKFFLSESISFNGTNKEKKIIESIKIKK